MCLPFEVPFTFACEHKSSNFPAWEKIIAVTHALNALSSKFGTYLNTSSRTLLEISSGTDGFFVLHGQSLSQVLCSEKWAFSSTPPLIGDASSD